MDERLKEIEEALSKATPGPWMRMGARVYPRESNRYAEDEICWSNSIPNAHLFANTPEWLHYQRSVIDTQADTIKRLTDEKERYSQQCLYLESEIKRLTKELDFVKEEKGLI